MPSRSSRLPGPGRAYGSLVCLVVGVGLAVAAGDVSAQEALAPAQIPNDEVMQELRQLRNEVEAARREAQEANQLKVQVHQLQGELSSIRQAQAAPGSSPTGSGGGADSGGGKSSAEETTQSPSASSGGPGTIQAEDLKLKATYKYQIGTGALGGGGYTRLADPDGEFSANLTNQITVDGTFFDRARLPTKEQGFNIPFARTFLYGNVTKNWQYQIGTQGFLGTFNLLDLWMSYKVSDALTIRAGRGLTPPLYEYTGFSPAMEPVITNSPLFQLAAKRPIGVMFLGNLFGKRVQYWSGLTNSGTATYYNLNRYVGYNGAVDFTPFQDPDSILNGLGGGVGFSASTERYTLNQGTSTNFTNNGESTTNSSFVTSSGVPFFSYKGDVRADGNQTRVAPHIYYFGRFSVLAEYMDFSRELAEGATRGRSTQRGYYVNLSYYLTGESDFKGNGFQGYTTIQPLNPFIPSRGQYGPGAWQLAAQFSELNVGTSDFARGFADPAKSTNRLDQVMAGVNWWPNKYTRLTFDYVWTGLNRPIPIVGPGPIDTFGTAWFRFAMFF